MVETLTVLSAQQLVSFVVAALVVFMAADLWRRCARAARVLGERASSVTRAVALGLALWVSAAIALTLVPSLRVFANSTPFVQPVVSVTGIAAVSMLIFSPTFRRAFDSLRLEDVLSFFYWRAILGMALLAFYTGGVLPAAFALPAAIGDAAITCVMVLLLAVSERIGRIPRRPLLVWNTLGLLDLVNALFLIATVLRPWAAGRGLAVGNYALAAFAVPLFIAIHLHIYARVFRDKAGTKVNAPESHALPTDTQQALP